ncbi:MAG: multi-sensor hybrid histidine kinase [Fibrobacteres bacterium]|nr:multi-sensor hybrid histidine kinase [Fibrobacterota bacterium]
MEMEESGDTAVDVFQPEVATARILYLEDDPADADLTRRGLLRSDPGIELEIVGTVAEAYAHLDEFEMGLARGEPPGYDLLLLDMHLPDGSGLNVLAQVRDRSLPLPVVVLTGEGDEEAVLSAVRAGADDYLPKKPGYWDRLPDAISMAVRNFRSRSELRTRPIRLLYVDPTVPDLESLRGHLAKHAPFIRLEAVDGAASALARLPRKGPVTDVDVILIDFRRTGVDALELLKEFNRIRKLDVPVLVATGQGNEEMAIQAVKLGAMDYLVKSPGYLQRLPLAVESAFYRSQAQRERNALRESEARFRIIFETEPECVKLLDREGRILEINPAGLAMLELDSIEEARRTDFIDFIASEYRDAFRELNQRVQAGASGILEFEMEGRKGTRHWLEIHAAPIRGKTGAVEALLGITLDMTDRKRNEEQLRQQDKMVAIGRLAGGIAHDFNNQLAAILGYAELLGAKTEDEESKRFIETIVQAAKRSRDLTRSLLAFSRQGQYRKTPIDLHGLIRETVEMLGRSLDKRIEVRTRLEADPATLIGDPSQIQNALLNLALNARDAMPEGGVLEFATETVSLEDPDPYHYRGGSATAKANSTGLPRGRYVHLSVRDTGCGMDQAVKKRLFEPFFTTKPVGKGTGMGLASVFGTVGLHNGSISAESESGRGTTFHIHFPLYQETKPEIHDSDGGQDMDCRLRILVVDDEPLLRGMLKDMLGKEGHTVATAENGMDALALYRGKWREIDLIILDMVMPGMSGWETFREIRLINPAGLVILSSGYRPDSEHESRHPPDALGFLAKPFEKSQLDALLAKACRKVGKT